MATIFGTSGNDIISDTNGDDTIYGLDGVDTIDGGNGNDLISGDLPALSFSFVSDSAVNSIVPNILFVNYFDFGGGNFLNELTNHDILHGGNGNDTIYGETVNVTRFFASGDATATSGHTASTNFFVGNFAQHLGSDVIYGDNGDDVIYGTFNQIYHDLHSGNAIADGIGAVSTSHAEFNNGGCADSGGDTIYGGNGNDFIVGGFNVSGTIGTATVWNYSTLALATNGGTATSSVDFIHEYCFGVTGKTIDGGEGNDIIYSDRQLFGADTISSGNAEAHNGSIAHSVIFDDHAEWRESSDTVTGGNGNDMIVGDVGETHMVAISLQAISTSNSEALSSSLLDHGLNDYGNDIIHGGNGNDLIYGDTITWSAQATSGEASTDGTGIAQSSAVISNATVINGNDTIYSDSGNDIIFGDGRDFSLSTTQGSATGLGSMSNASITNFLNVQGNDTIIGSKGNDAIVADILNFHLLNSALTSNTVNIDGINYLQASDYAANTIRWGNDSLLGGGGLDNFVFTTFQTADGKIGFQGFDVIEDFNTHTNTLSIGNLADRDGNHIINLNDLQLSTTLSHVGDSTIINFDGGGSLTLHHLDIQSLNVLHIQLSSSPIVV